VRISEKRRRGKPAFGRLGIEILSGKPDDDYVALAEAA